MAIVASNQSQIDSLTIDISSIQSQIGAITNSDSYKDCVINNNYLNCKQNTTNFDCADPSDQLKKVSCKALQDNLTILNTKLKLKKGQLDSLMPLVQPTQTSGNTWKYVLGIIVVVVLVVIFIRHK